MAEDNKWYGGETQESSELSWEELNRLGNMGDKERQALAEAERHHVQISKPEGLAEDEYAVRYTDDQGQEKDIFATRKPGNGVKTGNDEFDFWEPQKNPNTGKYEVHAEIENDLLTLGLNLYARNFYTKWYAEQKQAEAARQSMGNPEQIADGLKKDAEKLAKERSELRDELGMQGRQAPGTVEERLDRIERNQQIMMEQLNRIEEKQRSFFDKFRDKLGKGLEMLANGIEKVSKKVDKTADGLLLTSGAIQRGFDRLYGKAPVAEYPSTPQQEQKQAQGARDNSLGQDDIKDLKRIISELTNEVKGLKERIGQLEKDNKRLNEENNKLNKENRELFAQIQTGRQNNAPEKQSERRGPENREEAKAAPKVEEKAEQKEVKEQKRPQSNPESRKGQTEDEMDKAWREMLKAGEQEKQKQQNKVPEKQSEEAQPRQQEKPKPQQKEQNEEKQDARTLNKIDPDAELRNKNVLANNIVTGGHLVPLADASNVADEFKNVVNSKELMTPTGFETAFVYTALKNDEFNSNFVPAFNKMREEDRNWDNPERTNLECIVDLAQIALNESLRHDSTAVLCQGAGNTECFAYPKDQFNFDFMSNSITLRDMAINIARENGEILHVSEEEAHNLSNMHLNDLREKLPQSIAMAEYIGNVLDEMDISLKKGINLQPADLREAIKSNASEVINSFEQEGMNRQQAINATYNGYLKKLKYDASTVINNRIISAQGANGLEKIKRREADGSLKEISGAEAGFIDRDGNRYSLGAMDLRKKDVELTVGSEDKGERGENFERNGLKKQGMIR